ncbi:unnamed protein product [Mytilus coruscus]|uniref:B box-type domain-containing protein n=1 Tax=Mytilus coruscus TaxID=42192 RepID=A0A6J8DT66_MYTCO|nr:unnamed protein product [Mytilus coruscus]
MSSSKPIPCGPCQEGNESTKAEFWCHNCEEGLCSTCSGHHKRSKATRDHKTIDIKSYEPSIKSIKTECDKHSQQLILYCPSHLKPCCDECISTSHSKCTGIKSLASVVENTKVEISKESVEKEIDSTLHLFDKIVNNKSNNIKAGEQQCEGIKESILKIRENVNKDLDHFNKKLFQEVDKLLDQEKTKATDFITEIEGKRITLQNMQDHLHSVTTNTSKLQSFLCVYQIEQQVHQYQRYVEDLEKDDRVNKFEIKIKQNDEIERIINKLGSLESIGEVTVVKSKVAINRKTSVKREAQVESRDQSNISNMTMNIETKTMIYMVQRTTDMICLMDGRFIVVELGRFVNRVTLASGVHKEEFRLSGVPCSVTQIDQNTIAITYPGEKAIKIFNMENNTVTKVIELDKNCYNLSFTNNYLAVGLSKDEIRVINFEGETMKSIPVQSETNLMFFVHYNDRFIYSDMDGKAVYCVDGSGKQIWRYKQDLSSPGGLCTDTYGNIIVADFQSNTIRVISKDGQDSKILFSMNDELNVQCIRFNHTESSGFICDYNGRYLAKFNISYG